MIELLQRVLTGHNHKWEKYDEVVVHDGKNTIGRIVILRCTVCGTLRNHHIKW